MVGPKMVVDVPVYSNWRLLPGGICGWSACSFRSQNQSGCSSKFIDRNNCIFYSVTELDVNILPSRKVTVMKKIELVLVASLAVTFLPSGLYPNLSPGLSGQKRFSFSSQSLAYAEVLKDITPKMNQTLPAYPIRKPPVVKPVTNPAGRRDTVLPAGKTQPTQPGQQQQPAQQQQQPSNSSRSGTANSAAAAISTTAANTAANGTANPVHGP